MIGNNGTIAGAGATGPTIYPPYQQWADFNPNGGAYTDSGKTTKCTVSGTDTCQVLVDSITGNDVWQSGSTLRPIWYNGVSDGPNNTPYLKFDGSNDYLLTKTAFTATDTIDLWVVMRLDAWVSTNSPFTCFTSRNLRCNSATPQIWSSTNGLCSQAALGTWFKLHMLYTGLGAGQNYILNYTGSGASFQQSSSVATTTQISFGSLLNGTLCSQVSIGRVIAWQRPLSNTEITTVNNYINGLYGV
jgi:hypothetical protein